MERRDRITLGRFLDEYLASRTDIRLSTRRHLEQAANDLLKCFAPDRPLDSFRREDADRLRAWLLDRGLAENTVRRRCGRAKQFFNAAVERDYLAKNPFRHLVSNVRGNRERFHFVDRPTVERVLDACPDAEWRLIIALARYGGLRVPSELLPLRWEDVNWEQGRLTVHCVKTSHLAGREQRVIPIFPELRPHLQACFEQAEPGSQYVITRYRNKNANLRTQLLRIVRRAGVVPWEKPFQNMRSSRETELVEEHPLHVVCAWIGNTPTIASQHYLQVTNEHFAKAIRPRTLPSAAGDATNRPNPPWAAHPAADAERQKPEGAGGQNQPAADNGSAPSTPPNRSPRQSGDQSALQNALQHLQESTCNERLASQQQLSELPCMPPLAATSRSPQNDQATRPGLEPGIRAPKAPVLPITPPGKFVGPQSGMLR